MKFIVACGGTGGHAFPGLAVAKELESRGHEVVIWSAGRSIESSVFKAWGGTVYSIGAKPLTVGNLFANICSYFRCYREIKKMRPDGLLAMGNYSSLSPVLAARRCGVSVVLHEANTIPGRAIDLLSRYARKVAISFDMTKKYLPNVDCVKTGLPVRREISQGKAFEFIPKGAFVVFITGGSQGAHAVNELACQAMSLVKNELDERVKRGESVRHLYVIHQTGIKDEGFAMATYASSKIPSRVHAFEHEMPNAFASADLVIARAGASTCFELAACAKPAFMIPLPGALRNHQHYNAEAFVASGAADEGIQANLSPRQLARYILHKYDNPGELEKMSAAMKLLAEPDAALKVADLLEQSVDAK